MVAHPNAKTIWTTIEIEYESGQPRTVMIVETDLTLNASHPDFDGAAVDSLIEASGNHFDFNQRFVDRITLKSVKPD